MSNPATDGCMMINPSESCNPNPSACTLCNLEFAQPNVWWEAGRCTLDQIDYEIVIRVLSHVPIAKSDLLKITDDPILVSLANTVHLTEPEQIENDQIRRRISGANSIPYYTVLRGNIDGTCH